MVFRHWQVGLDIGNGTVRALALQYRREGWQLRHWWQHGLPEARPDAKKGLPPAGIGQVLADWRKQLPGSISLRVCLPACLMSQRRIRTPDLRLREPERGWFVASHAGRHFPGGDGGPLMFDYQDDPKIPQTLLVTAARQSAVMEWRSCLSDAGLEPQILDFMPCALRCMAHHAGLERDRLLVHRLGDGWCWVSPLSAPLESGFVSSTEAGDFASMLRRVAEDFPSDCGLVRRPAYCSSITHEPLPSGSLAWPSFDTLWRVYPPAPSWPAAFLVAGGLALRREDP